MIFREPRWLWLLALVPFAAIFFVARERLRNRIARRFVSERLRGSQNTIRRYRPWLLTAGLALAIFALSGPSRGFVTLPLTERESNRVVVIDVSNSMLATDIGTSRLSAAKAMARRLIDAWPGRVGLVEFEMAPEVVTPLTTDSDAAMAMLDSLQAGEVGAPGSDIGAALQQALRLVEVEPGAKADVVVISDGEDQGKGLAEAERRARERGIVVSTILVGRSAGAPIPQADGSELKDDSGKVVMTAAHAETLKGLAAATGGAYFENAYGAHDLDALLSPRTVGTARQKTVRIPVDRYQWPLSFAFVFLLLGSIANRGAE